MLEGKRRLTEEEKIELYWNNKHPRMPIIYNGRGIRNYNKRLDIDVRNMIWDDDYILSDAVDKYNIRQDSADETAWAAQRFICKILNYVGDEENSKIIECWQFPNETLITKCGDCEDGSLLMASLMLNAGIPAWRVRVTAGLVKAGNAAETGGHCYVTYCRETDNNWIILDWCYYPDPARPVNLKPLAKDIDNYKEIWFSFNSKYSWSHKQYENFGNIKEEPVSVN